MAGQPEDSALLIQIGKKLRQVYVPGGNWRIPDDVTPQLEMLDRLAWQSNRMYSLFDFSKPDYLYYSSNLSVLIGLEASADSPLKWDARYLSVVQNRKSISDFITIRQQLLQSVPARMGALPLSSVCGGTIVNLRNQRMRLHYRCTPLVMDDAGNVMLSFDYLEDITPLMTSTEGYWMRFLIGEHTTYWHSNTRRIIRKDIISPREKNLISLWRHGHSVAEIAEIACVNPQTVKNQLNTVRNRVFARDNTSLAQLCTLTGLLEPAF